MIGPKPRRANPQRLLEIILRAVVVAQAAVEQREVVQRLGDDGAVRAKRFLAHGQRLGEELLRRGVVAHDPIERREIILRVRRDRALRTERLRLNLDRLLVEGLGQVQVATVFLQRAERIEHLRHRGRFVAKQALADIEAAVERSLRLLVARHISVEPTEVEQRVRHRQRISPGVLFLEAEHLQAQPLACGEVVQAQPGIGFVVQGRDPRRNIAPLLGVSGARFSLGDDSRIRGLRGSPKGICRRRLGSPNSTSRKGQKEHNVPSQPR